MPRMRDVCFAYRKERMDKLCIETMNKIEAEYDKYGDGVITLEEMNNAIFLLISNFKKEKRIL